MRRSIRTLLSMLAITALWAGLATAANSPFLLKEGFESYATGPGQPWGTWVKLYNTLNDPDNNVVTSSQYMEGVQSLQLNGALYGMWSAVTYKPIAFPQVFTVEASVMNSQDFASGYGHTHESAVGLVTEYYGSGAGPWLGLVAAVKSIDPATGTQVFNISGVNGVVVANYKPMTWYKFRMLVNLPLGTVDYWVNNKYAGRQQTSFLQDYAGQFKYLALDSGSGRAWYDKVFISE